MIPDNQPLPSASESFAWVDMAQEQLKQLGQKFVHVTQDSISFTTGTLFDFFQIIGEKNVAYQERNKMLALVCRMAIQSGYVAGKGSHVDFLSPQQGLQPMREPSNKVNSSSKQAQPKKEGWDNEWRTVIYIDLPTGQISWHVHDSEVYLFDFLPEYQGQWDGHTTEEKWNRALNFK